MDHTRLRRRYSRRTAIKGGIASSAALSLALMGCGSDSDGSGNGGAPPSGSNGSPSPATSGPGEIQRGGTVVLDTDTDAPTLDPHLTSAARTYDTAGLVYSRLLTFDASPGLEPYANVMRGDLATDLGETPDGLTYTFKLRDGLKWQNREPVNGRDVVAEDIVYALERMRTPDPQYTNAYLLSVVDTIEAIDEQTVQFTLNEPFAPFLDNLAHTNSMILPRELIEAHGDAREVAVGTGPFMLDEHVPGTHYSFTTNPDYYMDGPYVDGARILIIPDTSLQMAAIRTGQIDHMIATSAARVEELRQSSPELTYHELPGRSGIRLVINSDVEPFNDVRVRQAIDLSIDRQSLIDTYLTGNGRKMFIFGGNLRSWDVDQSEIDAHWKQDYAEAQKLLDAAGFADGLQTEWELNTESDYQLIMELLQGSMREVGIDMSIKPVTYAEHRQNADTQNYVGFVTGVRLSTDPDATLFRNYHPESSQAWVKVDEYPDIVDLIDRTRTTIDVDERREHVIAATRRLIEESLVPGLFDPFPYEITSPRVQDLSPTGISGRLEWKHVWLSS